MLEIPESAVVARQARETLLGKTLTAVQVNASPHKFAFFFGDPDRYPALLIGATFTGGRALGGQVELSAGDLRLVDEADSLTSLRDALLGAYGDRDTRQLSDIMALAFAAAHLAGRYDVENDHG